MKKHIHGNVMTLVADIIYVWRCEMKFDAHHKLRIYIGLYSLPPLSLFKAHLIIVSYKCNNFFRIRTNINCCAVSYYVSTVLFNQLYFVNNPFLSIATPCYILQFADLTTGTFTFEN